MSNLLMKENKPKKPKANESKYRAKSEIWALQDKIRNFSYKNKKDMSSGISTEELLTDGGNSVLTRLLGWCSGDVCNELMYETLEEFFDTLGLKFEQDLC